MPEPERRVLDLGVRLEERADSKLPTIVGHAAVFDREAVIAGQFREVIRPGTFRRALAEGQDVRALIDHESSKVLGRSRAGTLRMYEDEQGLAVEIDPPDTSYARDLIASMARGDVTGMSFSFAATRAGQKWTRGDGEDLMLRDVSDADIYDVSVVTYPAYAEASAALRSLERAQAESDEALARARADKSRAMRLALLERSAR